LRLHSEKKLVSKAGFKGLLSDSTCTAPPRAAHVGGANRRLHHRGGSQAAEDEGIGVLRLDVCAKAVAILAGGGVSAADKTLAFVSTAGRFEMDAVDVGALLKLAWQGGASPPPRGGALQVESS
jgi:hypothetical protein